MSKKKDLILLAQVLHNLVNPITVIQTALELNNAENDCYSNEIMKIIKDSAAEAGIILETYRYIILESIDNNNATVIEFIERYAQFYSFDLKIYNSKLLNQTSIYTIIGTLFLLCKEIKNSMITIHLKADSFKIKISKIIDKDYLNNILLCKKYRKNIISTIISKKIQQSFTFTYVLQHNQKTTQIHFKPCDQT